MKLLRLDNAIEVDSADGNWKTVDKATLRLLQYNFRYRPATTDAERYACGRALAQAYSGRTVWYMLVQGVHTFAVAMP